MCIRDRIWDDGVCVLLRIFCQFLLFLSEEPAVIREQVSQIEAKNLVSCRQNFFLILCGKPMPRNGRPKAELPRGNTHLPLVGRYPGKAAS